MGIRSCGCPPATGPCPFKRLRTKNKRRARTSRNSPFLTELLFVNVLSLISTFRTPELARSNGRIDEIRLSLNSRGAAEGCSHGCRPWFRFLAGHEPRSGGRFCRRSAAGELHNSTSAFSRGYVLTPLRGWITHPEFLELRSSNIGALPFCVPR